MNCPMARLGATFRYKLMQNITGHFDVIPGYSQRCDDILLRVALVHQSCNVI